METRPKIEVPRTPADTAAEVVAWSALVMLWGLTIWGLLRLPGSVPIHYNGAGQPDHYGEKGSLLMLPLVATTLFAVLTAAGKFPHVLNYPAEITPANALSQYRGATRLMRGLKTGMVLLFLLLLFRTGQVADGQANGLGGWFMLAVLGLMGLPGVWYWLATAKAKQ